eukprot:840014-Prorocentrum_minimum.AAC.1
MATQAYDKNRLFLQGVSDDVRLHMDVYGRAPSSITLQTSTSNFDFFSQSSPPTITHTPATAAVAAPHNLSAELDGVEKAGCVVGPKAAVVVGDGVGTTSATPKDLDWTCGVPYLDTTAVPTTAAGSEAAAARNEIAASGSAKRT